MSRYEKIKQEKEETFMRASERDTEKYDQGPTASSCLSYALDKFTSYPNLQPKYLEKEANRSKYVDPSSNTLYQSRL